MSEQERPRTIKVDPVWKRPGFIYAFFFGFSLILWILSSLSKTYTAQVPLEVSYQHLAPERIITNPLPNSWTASLRGSGWALVYHKFFSPILSLEVDMREHEDDPAITTSAYLPVFVNSLSGGLNMEAISPLFIPIRSIARHRKKLAVKSMVSYDLAALCDLNGSERLSPDSIVIYGAEGSLDSFKFIKTDPLELGELSEATVLTIALSNPDTAKFAFNTAFVKLNLPIERFVEKTDTIRIKAVNKPDGIELGFLPASLSLKFRMPYSKVDQYSSDLFSAEVDYEQLKHSGSVFANVVLGRKPDYVRDIRMDPATVEYLIYE